MSLRLKFGVLLGLLGLAVLLTLGASWWAFSKLQAEVSDPLRSMAAVLIALGDTKQHVEQSRRLFVTQDQLPPSRGDDPALPPAAPAPTQSAAALQQARLTFREHMAGARAALERHDLADDWKIRSGSTSLKNLESRVAESESLGNAYFDLAESQVGRAAEQQELDRAGHARRAAHDELTHLQELIERIQERVARDTQGTGVDFAGMMRSRLLWVLGWAFLIVVLAISLGIVLIHRWILAPVAKLRTATARIAQGDFAYRIPLVSSGAMNVDELHKLSIEVNHMAGMVKSMQDDRVERERLAALGEMIRRLAHNLRNPLSGIRGLAEITRSDLAHAGPSVGELQANQSRIITAVDRFEKWLNELLRATRPMTIQPEPSEIPRWLTGLVEAHRPMAQTRGVELQVDTSAGPGEAVFDPRHLEHALSAMLSNAIEATSSPQARPAGAAAGHVKVEVHPADNSIPNGHSGQCWAVSITDQGAGVPPDLRETIFRPYFTTKRDGNGIGLATALQVVKAHGGQIVVESPWPPRENGFVTQPDQQPWPAGARFTVFLPVDRPILTNDPPGVVASSGRSGATGG